MAGLKGRPHLATVPTKQTVSDPDAKEWYSAMVAEVKSIMKNDTWELVESPNDREVIGSRMVLSNKYIPDGKLYYNITI